MHLNHDISQNIGHREFILKHVYPHMVSQEEQNVTLTSIVIVHGQN